MAARASSSSPRAPNFGTAAVFSPVSDKRAQNTDRVKSQGKLHAGDDNSKIVCQPPNQAGANLAEKLATLAGGAMPLSWRDEAVLG